MTRFFVTPEEMAFEQEQFALREEQKIEKAAIAYSFFIENSSVVFKHIKSTA